MFGVEPDFSDGLQTVDFLDSLYLLELGGVEASEVIDLGRWLE